MYRKSYIFLLALAQMASPGYAANPNAATPATVSLSGRVSNKQTHEFLPGVTLYFPDLKTGTITAADGSYSIGNLPASKVLLQVSYIGYNMLAEYIDLSKIHSKDFELESSVTELKEIVVTGLSQAAERNRTPTPITTIPPLQLQQSSATNIIDAIAHQPGISQVTTGSGISKPVIRGLGYNRVVTVSAGIRQEGQQWGDEHGIEIDEYAVNKVEILKGPASLAYGSDAMAGVINLISAPTLPEGTIKGSVLANYQTNNGLLAYSSDLEGNRSGVIWDLRYSNKIAHAYKNTFDGYVFNSGFRENALNGMFGVNKSWGYSELNFSAYTLIPGIIEGERDSLTGKFVKPVVSDTGEESSAIASEADYKSYTPATPYQQVQHYKAVLTNNILIGGGRMKAIFGFQQNKRMEFSDILAKNQVGLYFELNTLNYDIRYNFPEKNNYSLSLGINGMQQSSQNKGIEFLIPAYKLFDAGAFVIAKKSIGKLDISGGLRFDNRRLDVQALYLSSEGKVVSSSEADAQLYFKSLRTSFAGASGSLGATWQFSDRVYTKLNISRGFRAPNIAELSANGVHEGTVNYITGVPNLKPENSLQLDYAIGFTSNHVSGEANLYTNTINNYIFLRKLQTLSGNDSITDGYVTFIYASGNAHLYGGEFSLDIHPHPLDWLHFENTFSYVKSIQKNQPDSTKYLPMMPAPRFTSELKAVKKKLGNNLMNAYIKIGLENYFTQRYFYAAFGTETATARYMLINAGLGVNIVSGKHNLLWVSINADNITNVSYQSHLSRLKYTGRNNVTGRSGVFNMGRNISFKIIVPIYVSGIK